MKDIKMSGVFDMPLLVTDHLLFMGDNDDEPIQCSYALDAKAIAHAVNNHDRLVETLKEIANPITSADFKGNYYRNIAKKALDGIES